MRADVLVSSVSLACWRGRDVQDRRAGTRPTEPRIPLQTESATQAVSPPPSLSPAVGKTPVPPCSGEERSCCCCLELVEGPRNRSQGHILVTAWVATPPPPRRPHTPRAHSSAAERDAFPPEGPPQRYSEGPDCSMWPSATPRAGHGDSTQEKDGGILSTLVFLERSLLP